MRYSEFMYKKSVDTGKGWNTFGATVELSHGDDAETSFAQLHGFVNSKVGAVDKAAVVHNQELPPVIPGQEEVKKTAAKKVAKKATAKKAAAKNIPYNREVELHKDTLSELLEGHLGDNWYEQEGVVDKAKAFSEQCTVDKVELLDAKGNVLAAFKELIATEFKKSAKPAL